jgi:oxygen-independent coproporphyrinogen III oxidase
VYGVYVHLPWCRIRCPYCAFVVVADRDAPHVAYTDALLREWALRRDRFPGPPSTVFFGGGTPSRTPVAEIRRVVRALDPHPGAEISLEANPDDLDHDALVALRDAGINRLSVGAQTFDPAVGRRISRVTSARRAAGVIEAALPLFRSVSVDLIFAVWGQSPDTFAADLRRAVALGLSHVSLYGLTIEPGTPFDRAGLLPAADDPWADLYALAVDLLGAAGIRRYEVSNFARPGFRCVHNEHYWRARHWAGLGLGAHAWWPDGTRAVNTTDLATYLGAADPLATAEIPPPRALAAELIGSTLRHVDGLERATLTRWTALDTSLAPPHGAPPLATEDASGIRLLHDGFPVADTIGAHLCTRLRAAR